MSFIGTSMLRKLFGFIFCVFLIASCTENSRNIQIFEQNILRYNELLVSGYREMNMTPLREVATEEQTQRVYHHMSALGESGIRLESELKDIDILNVNYDTKDIVQVKTREIWDYYHVHIDTHNMGKKIEGLVYNLIYTFNKKYGRWMISNVASNTESEQQ